MNIHALLLISLFKMNKNNSFYSNIREILAISFPMMISMGCDTIMIFTDRMFLSRIEPELMNAAMGGGLAVFVSLSFFIGLIGFSTTLSAQYLGSGQKEKCAKVTAQALIIAIFSYVFVLLFGKIAAFWAFDRMGINPIQLIAQREYFTILLWGSWISLGRIAFSSFFSGIGRTRIVMGASFTAMLVNVCLNYVLIFGHLGFKPMGIMGAAYGTVIGGLSGLLVLLWGYFRQDMQREFQIRSSFIWDKDITVKFLRFGYPAGIELGLNMVAFNAVIMTFHSMGAAIATATTIMFNWDLVSFVPLLGAEIGVTSLVGRYMGAKDPQRAHDSVMAGLCLGTAYSFIILVLFVGFPNHLIACFKPALNSSTFNEAIPLAAFMIRWAAVYVMLEATFLVMIGAFRGAGDTFWSMTLSVTLHVLMAIVAWFGLRVFGLSPKFVWVCIVFLFLLCAFVVFLRYRHGAWQKINLVDSPPPFPVNDFHEPADI